VHCCWLAEACHQEDREGLEEVVLEALREVAVGSLGQEEELEEQQ